jgi:hypothetical protein
MEGTGEAFGGAAGRVISSPRTLRGKEEEEEDKGAFGLGEEVDITPSYTLTHCRRKRTPFWFYYKRSQRGL